jgi:hypothetical protein
MKTTLISGFAAVILTILACAWYIKRELRGQASSHTTTTISIDSSKVTNNYTQEQLTQYHRSTDTLTIPANVDTAAVLQRYFSSHYYKQEIRDTTADVLLTIEDSVKFNMLAWRSVNLRNLRATQIITTVFDTCKPSKTPFLQPYIGARIGIMRPLISQATPFIGVKIKGRWQADYGYNVLGREHQVSVSRDIFQPIPSRKK